MHWLLSKFGGRERKKRWMIIWLTELSGFFMWLWSGTGGGFSDRGSSFLHIITAFHFRQQIIFSVALVAFRNVSSHRKPVQTHTERRILWYSRNPFCSQKYLEGNLLVQTNPLHAPHHILWRSSSMLSFHLFYVYGSVHNNIFYEITNRCSYMQSILFHC